MVTNIYIKSFNRIFYLERSIASLLHHIKGQYQIIVLDDGTPRKYLDSLLLRYPQITIQRSRLAAQKEYEIEKHFNSKSPILTRSIPFGLWIENISRGSNIFLIIEDDFWITDDINLDDISIIMKSNNIVTLKFFWNQNPLLIEGRKQPIQNQIELIHPTFKDNSIYRRYLQLVLKNTCKLRTILRTMHLLGIRSYYPVYSLYSVAGAAFNREYWLSLWKNIGEKIAEKEQLFLSLKWCGEHPKDNYAKMQHEQMKTSFISSATNMFKDINFDIYVFNHYLNEAWLNGLIDPMVGYPNDFDIKLFADILAEADDNRCTPTNWIKWIEEFKGIYRKIGCNVNYDNL